MIVRIRHKKGMSRITLKTNHTIKDLKRKIKEALGVPATRQNLAVGNVGMERDSSIVSSLVENGTIITLSEVAPAKRKASSGSGIGAKKSKSAKKSGKKTKDGPEVFNWEGEGPEEIGQYIRAKQSQDHKIQDAGELVRNQTLREHRLSAEGAEKFKITELLDPSEFTSMARSRGKRYLSVEFSGGRKKRREVVAYYDEDTIKGIVRYCVRSYTTAKRVALKSALMCIGAETAAMWSPPLFWSICHSYPSKSVSEVFSELIKGEVEEYIAEQMSC
ncbi:hypothetical protein AAMO2058_001199200 [Amorphochlora amoebiformis]